MTDSNPSLAGSGLAGFSRNAGMTSGRLRNLCLAGVALALVGCARSESAADSPDPFGASIARQDRDQADAALQRQGTARDQSNAQLETRPKADQSDFEPDGTSGGSEITTIKGQ